MADFALTNVTALRFECGEGGNMLPKIVPTTALAYTAGWYSEVIRLCGLAAQRANEKLRSLDCDAAAMQCGKEEWDKVCRFAIAFAELSACLKNGRLGVPLGIRFIVE